MSYDDDADDDDDDDDDDVFMNEWMNTYIYIAPVKQKSSEALAAE